MIFSVGIDNDCGIRVIRSFVRVVLSVGIDNDNGIRVIRSFVRMILGCGIDNANGIDNIWFASIFSIIVRKLNADNREQVFPSVAARVASCSFDISRR